MCHETEPSLVPCVREDKVARSNPNASRPIFFRETPRRLTILRPSGFPYHKPAVVFV